MRRVIIIALGSGGLLLVDDRSGLRLPVVDFDLLDDPEEQVLKTLERAGFCAKECARIGDMNENCFFWVQDIDTMSAENEADGWLMCGHDPANALRRFARHCSNPDGQRIYKKGADLLEAHLNIRCAA